MNKLSRTQRVLAIDPRHKGFGFVVLEGERHLIDWGTREARGDDRNAYSLGQAEWLLRSYNPDALLLEDWRAKGARRRGRIPALLEGLAELADGRGAMCRRIPQAAVLVAIGVEGPLNKRQKAVVVAQLLPELALHLPPVRKPWMSEDMRSSIFSAAGLAIANSYLTGAGEA